MDFKHFEHFNDFNLASWTSAGQVMRRRQIEGTLNLPPRRKPLNSAPTTISTAAGVFGNSDSERNFAAPSRKLIATLLVWKKLVLRMHWLKMANILHTSKCSSSTLSLSTRQTGDGMGRPGDWCTHANHTRFGTIWGKNRDRVIDRIHSQFAILGNTFEPAAPGQFGSVLRYFRESMQQLPYVSAGAPSRNDAEIVSVALLLLLLLLLFQWSGVRNTCQKIVPETEPEVRFRRVSSRPNQTKPVQ